MGFKPQIVMLKYATLAISGLALFNAATVPKSGPSCAAPDNTNVNWVGCAVDNAWYGVSKAATYDHFSAEFKLCAKLGGHVAWMADEDEDSCAAQALIQTNTVDQYVVLSGDYHEDLENGCGHICMLLLMMTGLPEAPKLVTVWEVIMMVRIMADCLEKSKAMCRVDC